MKALYRKYRPLKLADVVGQPQVVEALTSAIKTGDFSHAYIFTGPRGCGKTSVARIFAHEINHFDSQLEDNYIDIIEIDGASNRGIDDVRNLREKATIAPTEGKFKIYIIDEVHMFTKEAFNALLKTLEEPPAHVIFLMATTDFNRLPITIISRSQVLRFNLADEQTMAKHLAHIAEQEGIKITPEALRLLVRRGGGSFRDTISLLDQISIMFESEITADQVVSALGLPRDELLQQILTAYAQGDFGLMVDKLKATLNDGTSPSLIASELIAQILNQPEPQYLPLLRTLTTVEGTHQDAKLLLALSHAVEDAQNFAQMPLATPKTSIKTVNEDQTSPQNPPKKPVKTKKEPKTPPKTPVEATQEPVETPSTESTEESPVTPVNAPEATMGTESDPSSDHFSVEVFLASITSASTSLGDILGKSTVTMKGNTITVVPEKKIYKSILKSTNNSALLQKYLAEGYSLEIADPGAKTAIKDPTLSQISDIMGGIQEVKTDQSDPF